MYSELTRQVSIRCGNRCEYCQLPSTVYSLPFQIGPITAAQDGGTADLENLALSCPHCNLHKATNTAGFDHIKEKMVRLFDPHLDRWEQHFRWSGPELEGLTAIGRVTIDVLFINDPNVIELRQILKTELDP